MDVAKTVFDRMPAPAQRRVRRELARRAAHRAAHDLRPFLARIDAAIAGIEGKRLVEIGSDHAGVLARAIADAYRPRRLIGLNPAFESRAIGDRIELRQLPAEHSGLPDASVDAVISSSAFEHISDVSAVLKEMYRVLVPGGLLYSHFGPLWSTSYGHHLWITDGAHVINYHNVLLPPWAHLLSTPGEVRTLLEPEHGPELADPDQRVRVRLARAEPTVL